MLTNIDALLYLCKIVLVLSFDIELSNFKNIRITESRSREPMAFFVNSWELFLSLYLSVWNDECQRPGRHDSIKWKKTQRDQ